MSGVRAGTTGRLEVVALKGVPVVSRGDDLGKLVLRALEQSELSLGDGDVIVVASKLVSRTEDRFRNLSQVVPSARAVELGDRIGKDPRLVELILEESVLVSREGPGVLIVKHRLGMVCANAGIDASNAEPDDAPPGSGPWVLLLPIAPDRSAAELRERLQRRSGASIGVVITDSVGRPFRLGTVGIAIGVSGLPALDDRRGSRDLFGRELEHTVTALADQIATAADLIAGQGSEGRGVVLVRGAPIAGRSGLASDLVRPVEQDLYVQRCEPKS